MAETLSDDFTDDLTGQAAHPGDGSASESPQWSIGKRLLGSGRDRDPEWHRLVKRAGVAYLLSRLCVMAGAAVVAA